MTVIAASNIHSLIIQQALHSAGRSPVKLNIMNFSISIDKSVCVHPGTIHMSVVQWDANIIKQKSEHMQTLWVMWEEIKNPPVLLDMGLWIRFESMNHIRELHSITNEEHWEVVPHKIKIPLKAMKQYQNSYKGDLEIFK